MKGKRNKLLLSALALSIVSVNLVISDRVTLASETTQKLSRVGIPEDPMGTREIETDLNLDLEKIILKENRMEEVSEEEKVKAELEDESENLKVLVSGSGDKELEEVVRESKNLNLREYSYKGDYDVSIGWETTDNSLIEIEEYDDGWGDIELISRVNVPEKGEHKVSLIATIEKNGYKIKKTFDYILKGQEEVSEEERVKVELADESENLKVLVSGAGSKELEEVVRESKNLNLREYSYKGDYDVNIGWETTDNNLIEIEKWEDEFGDIELISRVNVPEKGEHRVSLIATIEKNGYKIKKTFDYILKGQEEVSEEENLSLVTRTNRELENDTEYIVNAEIVNMGKNEEIDILIGIYREDDKELIYYSREQVSINKNKHIKTNVKFLIPKVGKFYGRAYLVDRNNTQIIRAEKLLK